MKAIGIFAAVSILAAAATVAAAPNILLLSIPPRSPGYYSKALIALGYPFTQAGNVAAFYAELTNGTQWNLVLIDNYDGPFDDGTLVALMNYVGKGGRCAMNHWDLDWALASAFGAGMKPSGYYYMSPIPMLRWEPANPLFTTPNAIPDLTPVYDPSPSTIDGFYLQPHDDATAVAGYTQTAADDQAAIVIGNEGRTILLGITPELFDQEMEKLLENCIEYLLAPAPPAALTVSCSSLTPAPGDTLTVDVTVQPLSQKFDAWGCILGQGSTAYSFTLGKPTRLRSGTHPLVTNVGGLRTAYSTRLLNLNIPPGIAGEYTIVVDLVPAGLDPLIPIDGYSAVKYVVVR